MYVKLRELGIRVQREWWVSQEGLRYVVDLALPVAGGWRPVCFGERPGPAAGLRFDAEAEPEACLREIQARLRISWAVARVCWVSLRFSAFLMVL